MVILVQGLIDKSVLLFVRRLLSLLLELGKSFIFKIIWLVRIFLIRILFDVLPISAGHEKEIALVFLISRSRVAILAIVLAFIGWDRVCKISFIARSVFVLRLCTKIGSHRTLESRSEQMTSRELVPSSISVFGRAEVLTVVLFTILETVVPLLFFENLWVTVLFV